MGEPEGWWSGFFDDAYIDVWTEQGAFDATAESVEQLIDLLDLPAEARVLDIPCGFGRFSQPLHDAGYDVTGVDLSPIQIGCARRDHPGPDYRIGDMRDPPAGPYDAVVNLFSSFGYFDSRDDDLRCLHAWFDVLRPGGRLVMELMHRDRIAGAFDPETDSVSDIETGVTNWVTGVRTSQVSFGEETREFRFRLYTATELIVALEDVGFADIEAYGDLSGAPLDPSTRLVLRALRPS